MVYGGPQAAGEMGRRIRRLHGEIYGLRPDGRRYHALEVEPYAWVHATLAEAIVAAHEHFARPLTPQQRECFWAEWRSLGRLLGIGDSELPASWSTFSDYFKETAQNTLARTSAVDEVLEALARPAAPAPLHGPAWTVARIPAGHVLRLASAGLLGPTLRQRFAVRWTRAMELQLRALCATLQATTPLMPSWLLNVGPGYLRLRKGANPLNR
jgi:uncharacterized protein (DUF2236 family)